MSAIPTANKVDDSCFKVPIQSEDSRADHLSDGLQNVTIGDFDISQAPFSSQLHSRLLEKVSRSGRPVEKRPGFCAINSKVPVIRTSGTSVTTIGKYDFIVQECKGEGAFGKVYSAKYDNAANPNETIAEMELVLKVQKPKNVWEFYIASELHQRLRDDENARRWFMSIPRCFVYNDGSVFVSERHSYSLLDYCNKMAALNENKAMREILAAYFAIELLTIVEKLHGVGIIHGDIKPDNFLVQKTPIMMDNATDPSEMFSGLGPALLVIDFGISLDMSLLPPGTQFDMVFDNKDIRTPEMLEGKKWSYQIDYFGIASIVFMLLYGSYIKINKNTQGLYVPEGKPKRWWSASVWNSFFQEFLNIESSEHLPNLSATRKKFEELLFKKHKNQFNIVASDLRRVMARS